MNDKKPQVAVTLGPACAQEEILKALLQRGVHQFRLNFSQADLAGHQVSLDCLRDVAHSMDRTVTVMGDLCGPRFRVGALVKGDHYLEAGEDVSINADPTTGNAQCFGTNYEYFQEDVRIEDRVLINEGRLVLRVLQKTPNEVTCKVEIGGQLQSFKGINLPDTHIRIPMMTNMDWTCIDWAREQDISCLLLSFLRHPRELKELREKLTLRHADFNLVAKIETLQATGHLVELATLSDQLLIARGDLGVEVGQAQVPRLQKEITKLGKRLHKPVILATHILHSMTEHPEPTRAEVADVANAVMDGVDTLLLTAETAIGKNPVRTVEVLQEIINATV